MKWGFSNKMKILQGKVSQAFPSIDSPYMEGSPWKMFFKKGKQILDQASMTHPQVHTSVSSDFLGSFCFLKELKLPNVTKIEANVNFEHFLNI